MDNPINAVQLRIGNWLDNGHLLSSKQIAHIATLDTLNCHSQCKQLPPSPFGYDRRALSLTTTHRDREVIPWLHPASALGRLVVGGHDVGANSAPEADGVATFACPVPNEGTFTRIGSSPG